MTAFIVHAGRSMYETDSIPEDWVAPASCDVDQVWVPSAFNKRTFMAAGVPEDRLRVLHEAVDTVSVLTPRPQKQKKQIALRIATGGSK